MLDIPFDKLHITLISHLIFHCNFWNIVKNFFKKSFIVELIIDFFDFVANKKKVNKWKLFEIVNSVYQAPPSDISATFRPSSRFELGVEIGLIRYCLWWFGIST